jgi:hypothetical protein
MQRTLPGATLPGPESPTLPQAGRVKSSLSPYRNLAATSPSPALRDEEIGAADRQRLTIPASPALAEDRTRMSTLFQVTIRLSRMNKMKTLAALMPASRASL